MGGGQVGCEQRIKSFVKIQKKNIFFFLGGGGGPGRVGLVGGGGSGYIQTALIKNKSNDFFLNFHHRIFSLYSVS